MTFQISATIFWIHNYKFQNFDLEFIIFLIFLLSIGARRAKFFLSSKGFWKILKGENFLCECISDYVLHFSKYFIRSLCLFNCSTSKLYVPANQWFLTTSEAILIDRDIPEGSTLREINRILSILYLVYLVHRTINYRGMEMTSTTVMIR